MFILLAQAFEASNFLFYEGGEGHGNFTSVQVSRTGGISGAVTCTVSLNGNHLLPLGAKQALLHDDFEFVAQSFVWQDGELGTKDVSVFIRENNVYEGIDKCMELRLDVVGGGAAARSGYAIARVTIKENEPKPRDPLLTKAQIGVVVAFSILSVCAIVAGAHRTQKQAKQKVRTAEIQLTNSLRALYPEGAKTSCIVKVSHDTLRHVLCPTSLIQQASFILRMFKLRLAEEIKGKTVAQRLRLSRFEVSFDSFELFEVLGKGGFATARARRCSC